MTPEDKQEVKMERKVLLRVSRVFTVVLMFVLFVFCAKVIGEELTKEMVDNAGKKELMKMCEERGLPPTGSATELRERINDFLEKLGKKAEPAEEMIDESLIAYYNFDEGRGDEIKDSSMRGNNGRLNENFDVAECWVEGIKGPALMFNGVDNFIRCGNNGILDCTSGLTIDLWMKPDKLTIPYGYVISKDTYVLRYDAGGTLVFVVLSSNKAQTDIRYGALTEGKWYHIVCTWDKSKMRIYVNGLLSQEQHAPDTIGTAPRYELCMGADYWNTQSFYKGIMDEVRIYNRALSEEEVKEHYRIGASKAK